MHVAIVTPDGQTPGTGNQVLAQRLLAGLRSRGVAARIMPVGDIDAGPAPFDLYHVLHASTARSLMRRLHGAMPVPFTLTCTGTDILVQAARHPARRQEIGEVLQTAAGIATLHGGMHDVLTRLYPDCAAKAVVITQGVTLPRPEGGRRQAWGIPDDASIFLLPAGVRPVKRPLMALRPLERLRQRHPSLVWLIAGPVRHEASAAALQHALEGRPWARYLGEIPRPQLTGLYRLADVVLNTSSAEGMPNALLEAMALGRPVLASDVSGNRALIADGRDGLLFETPSDLRRAAASLIEDPELARRLGRAAERKIRLRHRPEDELDAYLRLFDAALGRRVLASGP